MATLGRALAICAVEFQDVTDKGGRPYMEHCLYVMDGAKHLTDQERIAFLLHDLFEDRPKWTAERMRSEGFTQYTIDIMIAMTHLEGESYDDYIRRISMNPMARIGKRRDLRSNMDVTRLKGLRRKDFDRLEKYARAYEYLKD